MELVSQSRDHDQLPCKVQQNMETCLKAYVYMHHITYIHHLKEVMNDVTLSSVIPEEGEAHTTQLDRKAKTRGMTIT